MIKWTKFVADQFSHLELTYRPSQLTEILRFSDDYLHQNSALMEYGEEIEGTPAEKSHQSLLLSINRTLGFEQGVGGRSEPISETHS